jgi:hypothetical protein
MPIIKVMEDDYNKRGFLIPESFLTQLEEYTRGYMLLVCNEKGELYAHEAYDNPVIKLGVVNFAHIHVKSSMKHMHNIALKEEEEHFKSLDDDSDDSRDDDDEESEY